MKHSFLKSSVSLICLLPALAIAGGVEKAPTKKQQWQVDAGWLYLEASASNLDYAVYTTPLPLPAPNWQQKFVYPPFKSGVTLGASYTFDDQVNQLKIDWINLDVNATDSATAGGDGASAIAPPYYFGPADQRLRGTSASGQATFNLNQVNLVYDRIFTVGSRVTIQPFVGLGAAYLKQALTNSYAGTNQGLTGTYTITQFSTSRFKAMGPRIGAMTKINFGHGLGMTANIGSTILAGSMASNTHFLSNDSGSAPGGNTTPTTTTLADNSQTAVVPEFDTSLGLTYSKQIVSGSVFMFEAGYLFSTYLDGINQVQPTSLVPGAFNNGSIAIETSAQVQSNYSINGPYIKASYAF